MYSCYVIDGQLCVMVCYQTIHFSFFLELRIYDNVGHPGLWQGACLTNATDRLQLYSEKKLMDQYPPLTSK